MIEAANGKLATTGERDPPDLSLPIDDLRVRQLMDALMLISNTPGELTITKLAYWLRSNHGKIVGGLVLEGELDRLRTMRWVRPNE